MEPRVLQNEVKGEGDPIVLVPGILTGWLSWTPHAERLSEAFRTVRVQPIHSELATRGELPPAGFGAETERESLGLTLDALGIDRAHLAGWSGGGRALIEFSLAYPERVRTLTLIEPAAYWILDRAGVTDPALRYDARFSEKVARRPVMEEELVEFLTLGASSGSPEELRADPRWPVWVQNRNALASDLALGPSSRSLDDLASFDRPVLLVYGTETAEWLKKIIEILGERYPNARTVALPGDHACHIQSIDLFLEEFGKHTTSG